MPPQGGFGIDPRLPPRMARPPAPAPRPTMPMNDEAYGDDQYYAEQPEPRTSRRSAADYQQAYRDMEDGYEEDAPRSRGPWILLALLLLALGIAAGAVWFYLTSVKPMMNGKPAAATTEEVPVVDPPAGAAKVEPEPPAATAPEQAPAGKKRIYDRIVGDQEVLGGEMAPTEEVPLAPADGSSQLPDPVAPAGDATGEDAAPLPIPPPPGDGNTQGSLPEDPNKQSASLSDPAAGDSQAAVVASEPAPAPPAPGETVEPTSADGQQEAISDEEPVVIPKKKLPVKPTKKKTETEQNLGSKPVVLVPPKKKAKADPSEPTDETTASVDTAAVDDAGLYGDTATSNTAPAAPQPAPVKKKKTLADLFNGTSENEVPAAEPQQPQLAPEPAPAPAKPASAAKPKAAPEQPAETQVATASGYAAQLASFRTKQEASAEFSRLKSKHGAILQGFSPIVSEAQVAGSTRYRLAVGGMASKDQANALCSKLIAAGERDCIVKRQ